MVSCGEVWLAVKKMEAVMVGQVAQQVVPSGPNPTMGADFFLPYRTPLLTFSCPPPPPPSSPPGKFFLPSCSIFLAPSAPRWHRGWSLLKYSNSNQEGGADDAASLMMTMMVLMMLMLALMILLMMVMMMVLMMPMMKIFKLGGL